jgi:leucyl aminopeptidase
MKFTFAEQLLQEGNEAIVVGIFKGGSLTPSAQAIDTTAGGQIKQVLAMGDFKATPGEVTTIFSPDNLNATSRLLLVGLGEAEKLDEQTYLKVLRGSGAALKKLKAETIACFLPEATVDNRNYYWKVRLAVETFAHAAYKFDEFKSKDEEKEDTKEQTVTFPAEEFSKSQTELAVKHGAAIADGVKLVRDLGNTPGNICTPEYIADTAKEVAKEFDKLRTHVLSEREIINLKMGAFAAVAQGSEESAKFVILEYNGGDKHQKPIALVGKGITFDTGGISLKPSNFINGMKYDMCGAASVLAAIRTAAALELPINVVAFLACAENMPDGKAARPDDVITTMSGKTVEIANTDAEGRLVLCDAITYAQRYEPEVIIDVATLTGAIVVALGNETSGIFSNSQELADELLTAGQNSLDRAWQLPIWKEYQQQLDSGVADMMNIGTPGAQSITAACFLARFAEDVNWAHVDVAGTAFKGSGKDAAASGRPAPMLSEFLLRRADVIPT